MTTEQMAARIAGLEAALAFMKLEYEHANDRYRQQLAARDAELADLRHPNSTLARCCSWCLQPYTDITTLRPTSEDNERIKADARQHFLTCSAHPAVAAKEQAEAELADAKAKIVARERWIAKLEVDATTFHAEMIRAEAELATVRTALEFPLAQLRHAYKNAIDSTIGDQPSFGRYLLGPAITRIESALATPPRRTPSVTLCQCGHVEGLHKTGTGVPRGCVGYASDGSDCTCGAFAKGEEG